MLSYQGAGSVELNSIGPVPIPQAVPESLRAATACVVLDLSYALGNQGIPDPPSYRILSSLTALRRCPAQHSPAASPGGRHTGKCDEHIHAVPSSATCTNMHVAAPMRPQGPHSRAVGVSLMPCL